MNRLKIIVLTALALPTAALAQAPAAAPEPARLAAAKRLVDVAMPPAQRDTMMRSVIQATLGNVQQALQQNPDFAKASAGDPRVRQILSTFMDTQARTAADQVVASMPQLMAAMANAYARRFTVTQLNEVTAFYQTPTGQAFITQMATLMADPDVQTAQREMMTASLSNMKTAAAGLARQLAALNTPAK
ncbi:DUF2059 domain-containing protein [uncultured Sphingomonas sp.]|uniref:DUF2059 domain-containing protein n=1 Tax=uncultured Sphingomonas sp. TaxID=158754 RepID=UPI0025E63040|nr:DUF2059 domain-containing protein [uncultured Sphingomonas sp.]